MPLSQVPVDALYLLTPGRIAGVERCESCRECRDHVRNQDNSNDNHANGVNMLELCARLNVPTDAGRDHDGPKEGLQILKGKVARAVVEAASTSVINAETESLPKKKKLTR